MTGSHRTVAEVVVAAPPGDVWRALRDPAEIRRWHGWEYDGIEAEIDEIYVRGVSASESDGVIDLADGETRFTAVPSGSATAVLVAQAVADDEPSWDGTYDVVREGWTSFLQQLRFYLERHRGEDRGTLALTGDDGPPVSPEELGLRVAAAGERYEATTPWGDPLAGEVWFRSEHQIGVTVDAWGDGLLVLAGRPAGGGMAILTTHGLPGEDADGLRAAWTTWWEQRGR